MSIYLLWLIPLIALSVIFWRRGSGVHFPIGRIIAAGILVMLVLVYFRVKNTEYDMTEEIEKVVAARLQAERLAAKPPPPPPMCGSVERMSEPRRVPFPVYLCKGWQDYALDGPSYIIGHGHRFHSVPGEQPYFGDPPEGWYMVVADPPESARRMQFRNRGPQP